MSVHSISDGPQAPAGLDKEMMGSTPDAVHRKVAREATDWLLLLSEEPQDMELRRRFEAWRDKSPLHHRVWASTLHASGVRLRNAQGWR